MKKVLFTATVDSHILQFHLPFLKMFKERGYEVHVATNGNEEIPYCDVKHCVCFERSPIKFNNLKAIRQLKKICNKEKFNIIHTHTPMGSVVTRLAAKKSRKKYNTRVIYTAHGFHFFKGISIKNWLLFYPIEKWLAKYTNTLLLVNEEDYNLAKKKFNKRCKNIKYVPGVGIDDSRFHFDFTENDKQQLKKDLGLKKDDFVLTYIARLDKNKNQGFLIDMIKKINIKYPNIHLLLVGPDELNNQYHEQAKDVINNVHFLGYRNDIPKLLEITDVSVSSSLREGLPINILEAMSSGTPVVATDTRGVRDLIINGRNGYIVKKNNIDEFIDRILFLYNNKEITVDISKNNLVDIKKYSLSNILNDMGKIYFDKKGIAYLRSTAIFNDSRATKEIKAYNNNDNNVLVFGWNRKLENINFKENNLNQYNLFNLESNYGSGVKNIFKMLKFNHWLKKQLKKNIDKIDIIHACDFDTARVAKNISKKYHKKLIYDIYDYYVDCHNLGILKGTIEKRDIKVINYADYVLLCTEKRKEQISKSHPKKIEIIHNSPETIKNITKKTKNDNEINIGYFGILQDNRLLIEISKEIIKNKNIIFHVGGFGKYEQYFKKLSDKYSNIKFYGTLTYSDVLEKEKECDILFATYDPKIKNHKYSAPNKVYEAMALNLPIIVCHNTGVDEMVIKEGIGDVINYDATEFISSIYKLKSKKNIECNEVFKNKYSWEIMGERLNEIIDSLRG